MTTVMFYEKAGFPASDPNFPPQGNSWLARDSVNDLRDYKMVDRPWPLPDTTWNDQASSLKIEGGSVRFFHDINYQGKSVVLGPGNYSLDEMKAAGLADNEISSFKFL